MQLHLIASVHSLVSPRNQYKLTSKMDVTSYQAYSVRTLSNQSRIAHKKRLETEVIQPTIPGQQEP